MIPSNFNPRAPCGARLAEKFKCLGSNEFQSTRPVRGATIRLPQPSIHTLISIHAPRAGRDQILSLTAQADSHFNPRAPCGARPHSGGISGSTGIFQSTRPVRGATTRAVATLNEFDLFQSTRPVRGATIENGLHMVQGIISIHAPRAGRDSLCFLSSSHKHLFQSTRPVRGATRVDGE